MKKLLVTAMVASAVLLGCGEDGLNDQQGNDTSDILVIPIEQESQQAELDVVYHPSLTVDAVRDVTTVHLETFPWNPEVTKIRVEPVDGRMLGVAPSERIFTQGARTCITFGEKLTVVCAHYVDFATSIEDENPQVTSLYGHHPNYQVIDAEDD